MFYPKKVPGPKCQPGDPKSDPGLKNRPLGMKKQKMRAEKPCRIQYLELQTEPYCASYDQKPFWRVTSKSWYLLQEGKPCFQKGESCVQKGVHWDTLELIVLTWLHLDSLETMCFAGVLRPSVENGTEEQAWQTTRKPRKNHNKQHQNSPGVSRTHPGSTTETPRSRRTTFYSISRHKSSTKAKGTDADAARSTNLTLNPQRQDHARRKDLDFPVGLTPQPPIL